MSLVGVAANVSRAFAVVHEQGHVVGDVNHGNLLVRTDGTVKFIDCDSFQIRKSKGHDRPDVYTCDVGVPLYTAPELHGRAFRGLDRDANHDRFGLAVLLFHLLYMGRHPFAGRYSGSGEMPIEKAIGEYRFAYGPDGAAKGMERPPGTVPLETMGRAIAQLFIHAFGHDGSIGVRPDAKTWVKALEGLQSGLRVCSTASWHHYPGGLAACPWCTVESQANVCLFGQWIVVSRTTKTIDLAELWRAILAVPDPGAIPAPPSERPWHLPPGIEVPSRKPLRIFSISVGLVFAGFVAYIVPVKDVGIVLAGIVLAALLLWPRASADKRAAANGVYQAAKAEWEGALAQWKREASPDVFARKREALEKARAEMKDLPNEQRRRLAKLEAKREMRQRQRYLNRFRISRTNIPGIGVSRSSMLASYGIETAADIKSPGQILQIPGFGEVMTSELMQWRKGHERNFQFNPSEPVDRREIDAINRELDIRRQSLLATLRQGPDELRRLRQEIIGARERLMPTLEKAWDELKIAEARRNAL